jgi:hypothetical protein
MSVQEERRIRGEMNEYESGKEGVCKVEKRGEERREMSSKKLIHKRRKNV